MNKEQRIMHDDWDRRFYEQTGEWPVQNLEHAPVRKGRLWRIFNATYGGGFADAHEQADAVFKEIVRQAERERQAR